MNLDKTTFLEAFPSFRNGPNDLLETILNASTHRKINKGMLLYTEGDTCNGIGFFLKGEVRVFKSGESGREITLYELFPGDTCILNASSILSNSYYPANAQCLSDISLLLLPKKIFLELFTKYDVMRTYIFTILSRRLSAVIEMVEEVAFGKLDIRIKDYLVEKAENDVVNLTHQQIANDLGSSREVISRMLKEFENKDEVILHRKKIEIKFS
jgi:CRP/FNR family transcriptional regulator